MGSKEELLNNVKEWIKMDNEISKMKKNIKENNNKKKLLTDSLVNVMRANDIDCFDFNGGSIIYKQNKVKKPINGKTLLGALKTYYQSDPSMAETIAKHILDSREESVKECILRK
jgi:hypothetical protein